MNESCSAGSLGNLQWITRVEEACEWWYLLFQGSYRQMFNEIAQGSEYLTSLKLELNTNVWTASSGTYWTLGISMFTKYSVWRKLILKSEHLDKPSLLTELNLRHRTWKEKWSPNGQWSERATLAKYIFSVSLCHCLCLSCFSSWVLSLSHTHTTHFSTCLVRKEDIY
jgi:hypothetical protein